MIRQTLDLSGITPLNRTQIEHLAHVAGRFHSRILFEHRNRTINGKSMLGILSLGATGADPVVLTVEGDDEEAAFAEVEGMLKNGVAPPKDASDALTLIQLIKTRYMQLLPDSLTGIYLHGSLAAGCFQWDSSDIDFLVVVRRPLTLETKMALAETLRSMTQDAPPKGFEMSVILEKYCRDLPYPMPFEMHYSRTHQAAYDRDPAAFCRDMHGEDPDLTAHILDLRAFGKVIFGPGIPRLFGQVKRQDALRAIRYDLDDAQAPERLHGSPVYYVLNLCRAVAYCRDNRVLSKQAGGEWALAHLDASHQPVIQAALNAYGKGLDMFYDRSEAEDFCAQALDEISRAE